MIAKISPQWKPEIAPAPDRVHDRIELAIPDFLQAKKIPGWHGQTCLAVIVPPGDFRVFADRHNLHFSLTARSQESVVSSSIMKSSTLSAARNKPWPLTNRAIMIRLHHDSEQRL